MAPPAGGEGQLERLVVVGEGEEGDVGEEREVRPEEDAHLADVRRREEVGRRRERHARHGGVDREAVDQPAARGRRTRQFSRGGTIHRCIDISRYFSRDMYHDIIFYNRDFY